LDQRQKGRFGNVLIKVDQEWKGFNIKKKKKLTGPREEGCVGNGLNDKTN